MTAPGFRATFPRMTPSARLALSEKVIDGWERVKPGGRIEDTLRMIGQELAELRKVAADAPELADRVEAVSERYGRLHLRLKLGAH